VLRVLFLLLRVVLLLLLLLLLLLCCARTEIFSNTCTDQLQQLLARGLHMQHATNTGQSGA
jgi:hypothetical protein